MRFFTPAGFFFLESVPYVFQTKRPVDSYHAKSSRWRYFFEYRDIVAGVRDCRGTAIPDEFRDTATHCNTLQLTATHCNSLQHTAARYSTLYHTAAYCDQYTTQTLWRHVAAAHCNTLNTLQHTATHCNVHTVATACHRSTLQHTATHTPTWQHVTVAHCNTLQHADRSDVMFDVVLCAKTAIIHWSWFNIQYSLSNTHHDYYCTTQTTPQHTATHNLLFSVHDSLFNIQYSSRIMITTALHCTTLHHTATHCSILQHTIYFSIFTILYSIFSIHY